MLVSVVSTVVFEFTAHVILLTPFCYNTQNIYLKICGAT